MTETIYLDHGNGGRLTHELIERLFVRKFGIPKPLTDSAILSTEAHKLAFTTDAYVVNPIFFPGGDIGKLAVCGTVNDLAVSGADPLYISVSFIIEEGFPYQDLEAVVCSMAEEAEKAGVRIVTGDTKVVEKGKCDRIFIVTSGVGAVDRKFADIACGKKIKPGDRLIVNGNLADHAIAVLAARKQLQFVTTIRSDCASLNHLIRKVLDNNIEVKFMRDLTRGGLATVLNELTELTGTDLGIQEGAIPVDDQVRGLCEIFGFDPLYMANEGKVLFVIGEKDVNQTMEILRSDPLGTESRMIGEIMPTGGKKVVLSTVIGGKRILDMLTGEQLPRIC
jgi:hydrogenase expression/formation protein HypE